MAREKLLEVYRDSGESIFFVFGQDDPKQQADRLVEATDFIYYYNQLIEQMESLKAANIGLRSTNEFLVDKLQTTSEGRNGFGR